MTARLALPGLDTAIPENVRGLAEKTVAQTREVYDRSKDALDASIATFEGTFDAAGQGAVAFNRKIIIAGSVNSGFDRAKSFAGAKNFAEIVELQTAHWRKQFDALTAQAEEVRTLSTKVTGRCGPLSLIGRRARQPADDLRHIKATALTHASLASATRLTEWRAS